MMKFLIAGAVLSVAVPALAQVTPAPAPTQQVERAPRAAKMHTRAELQAKVAQHFARLDSNRDGFVTKAETEAAPRPNRTQSGERGRERRARGFERFDANRDGMISRAEWDAHSGSRGHRRSAGSAARNSGRHDMHGMGFGAMRGQMFERADANRDGRVSQSEAQAAALRHFDMMDLNRDGQIAPQERMQMRQRMRTGARRG